MEGACPYCRTPFADEDEIVGCSSCCTRHHVDCFAENGGCTVFGCVNAPGEEPKVSVSNGDLVAGRQPAPAASLARSSPTPPPPRPLGGAPPPPPPIRQAETRFTFGGYVPAPATAGSSYEARKSRVVFVLLALLLGAFGGHNFYAGYVKKAVVQLCITIFSCFLGSFVSWIWAIVEACVVDRDDDGVAFV